ncbi:MAG: hypothetical protein IJS58_02910 [Bacilli bacterium]|nr:hypothetical protein [Bacilli bacterium]
MRKGVIKSRLLIIIGAILIFSIWFFNVIISKGYLFDLGTFELPDGILFCVISFYIFILLIFKKDSFESGTILMMLPFSIMQDGIVDKHLEITETSYIFNFGFTLWINIAVLLIGFGLLIHFLIYRPKFRLGSFTWSLILLFTGVIVCTILKKIEIIQKRDLIIIFSFLIAIFLLYEYYAMSNESHSFKDIAFVLLLISLLIIGERIALYYASIDYNSYSDLGITIFAIPFIMYYLFYLNNVKAIFKNIIILLLLSFIMAFVIYVYPFISVLILASIIFSFLVSIRKTENKLLYSIFIIILLIITSGIIFGFEKMNYIDGTIIDRFIDGYRGTLYAISGDDVTSFAPYRSLIESEYFNKLLGINYAALNDINSLEFMTNYNIFRRLYLSFGIVGLFTFLIFSFDVLFKTLRLRTRQSVTIAIACFALFLFTLFIPKINLLNILIVLIFVLSAIESNVNAKLLCVEGSYE